MIHNNDGRILHCLGEARKNGGTSPGPHFDWRRGTRAWSICSREVRIMRQRIMWYPGHAETRAVAPPAESPADYYAFHVYDAPDGARKETDHAADKPKQRRRADYL
ncbi:MAG: hypothetical protein GPOALKHO_000113 [Sodalis sp.]|nr:MAG: hypothetical protein GPOALKHO_000113 [Sodalis sp.]